LIIAAGSHITCGQTQTIPDPAPATPNSSPAISLGPPESLSSDMFYQMIEREVERKDAQDYVDWVKKSLKVYTDDTSAARFEAQEIKNVEDDIDNFDADDGQFMEEKTTLRKDFWILIVFDNQVCKEVFI
jgi:hypothetical protein